MITPLIPDPSPTPIRNGEPESEGNTDETATAAAEARARLLAVLQWYTLNRLTEEVTEPVIAWVQETARALTLALEEIGKALLPIMRQWADAIAGLYYLPKPARYTHSARQDVPRLKRGKHIYQLYVRSNNARTDQHV